MSLLNNSSELTSSCWTIQDAPGAGRGAFATQTISAGETVMVADDLYAHVLFREYRGELCCNCFAYNLGEKQPVKDAPHGLAFCSEDCKAAYMSECDELSLQAHAAVTKLLKAKTKKQDIETPQMRPSVSNIEKAWKEAEAKAHSIKKVRNIVQDGPVSKIDFKNLDRAMTTPASPDTISFLLSAVLAIYRSRNNQTCSQWSRVLNLEPDTTPYLSTDELNSYTASYLHLAMVLPEKMLPFISSEMIHTLKTRETHNCFGIRSLTDGGSEFFGYGVWPSASYFNHSCDHNVRKTRVGKMWVFEAMRDIPAGEQLCISYIGGEDSGEALGWRDKSTSFKEAWGFDHVCEKCQLSQTM
ncbi:hypothetical protein OQA88_11828 [Cercophora sp. LCS_1]